MEQTAQFSASTANSRGRRAVVCAMLFAWLAWLLTCPNVMDGVSAFVPAGGKPIAQHATTDSTLGSTHDDVCCAAAPHAAAPASAQKFNLPTYFRLTFLPPIMVTSLTALVVVASNRDFMRSSWSGWTKHSLIFGTLWPQAPPR